MSMVKQLALRSVHKVSAFETVLHVPVIVWSPAKFIISNNAKVPVLMNLFSMTVFKTKSKVKRAKLIILPSFK